MSSAQHRYNCQQQPFQFLSITETWLRLQRIFHLLFSPFGSEQFAVSNEESPACVQVKLDPNLYFQQQNAALHSSFCAGQLRLVLFPSFSLHSHLHFLHFWSIATNSSAVIEPDSEQQHMVGMVIPFSIHTGPWE